MQRRAVALLAASALLACGGGKATRPEPKLNRWGRPIPAKAPRPPAWIDTVPDQTRTRVYAVGFSGATFWPQDAIGHAAEDARGKLALALSAHYEVLGESVETATAAGRPGAATDNLKQLDLIKAATDLVVQNSRIESTWIDERGVRGEAGSAWALAVLDTGASRQSGAVDANGAGEAGLSGDGRRPPPAASNGVKSGKAMPGWLDRLPASGSRIYAAGYSGPTFEPAAALGNASDAAIDNLCAALHSHVQAYTLLIETGTGLSVDDFSRTDDPEAQLKDLVTKSARIEAVWVDAQGRREGDPPGAVWALAGIDVGSAKGGYDVVQDPDTGPALDAQGNIPAGAKDAPPDPTPVEQEAQHARDAQAAAQQKAAQTRALLDAHNAAENQAVQAEQAKYRAESRPANSSASPAASQSPAAPGTAAQAPAASHFAAPTNSTAPATATPPAQSTNRAAQSENPAAPGR